MEEKNYIVSEIFEAINNLRGFIQDNELESKTGSYVFNPIDYYLDNSNKFSAEDREKIDRGLIGIVIAELKERTFRRN